MKEKYISYIGWFASAMAIAMYVSYIDQIKLNLAGEKGSVLQPLAATINCIAWSAYAFLKEKKTGRLSSAMCRGFFWAGLRFILPWVSNKQLARKILLAEKGICFFIEFIRVFLQGAVAAVGHYP